MDVDLLLRDQSSNEMALVSSAILQNPPWSNCTVGVLSLIRQFWWFTDKLLLFTFTEWQVKIEWWNSKKSLCCFLPKTLLLYGFWSKIIAYVILSHIIWVGVIWPRCIWRRCIWLSDSLFLFLSWKGQKRQSSFRICIRIWQWPYCKIILNLDIYDY